MHIAAGTEHANESVVGGVPRRMGCAAGPSLPRSPLRSRLCSEAEAAVLSENSGKGFNDRTIPSSSNNSSKISQPQTIQMGDIFPNIRELTYFLYLLVGRQY